MKKIIFLFSAFIFLSACKKTEHGAPDAEIMARKLFDTSRDNDFSKSEYLMPDKGTFRKIQEQRSISLPDIDSAYDAYIEIAENHFNTLHSMLADWNSTKYLRIVTEDGKAGNLPALLATTKFESTEGPCKFTFTAIKFNNRWYYDGDILWIPKSE